MTTFRVPPDRARNLRSAAPSVMLWVGLLSFSAVLVTIPLVPDEVFWRRLLAALLVLSGSSTILAIVAILLQQGTAKLKSEMQFELSDGLLIQRRPGWPDISLRLSDVTFIRKSRDWLRIESSDPEGTISVPSEVEGINLLVSSLPDVPRTHERPASFSVLSAVVPVALLAAWAFMLMTHSHRVFEIALGVLVLLQAVESAWWWKKLVRSSRRPVIWSLLVVPMWILAACIAYFRLKQL